jgi:hypothetical protein
VGLHAARCGRRAGGCAARGDDSRLTAPARSSRPHLPLPAGRPDLFPEAKEGADGAFGATNASAGSTKKAGEGKVRVSPPSRGLPNERRSNSRGRSLPAPPRPRALPLPQADGGMTVTAAQPNSLDEYDPRVQAEKEREALVATVSAMRTEASRLQAELGDLHRRYETVRIDYAQLAYEDDVDSERQAGVKRMVELKARIEHLSVSLEDTEGYQRTLGHMLKRSGEEKLSHIATLKAFEDAIRVHK